MITASRENIVDKFKELLLRDGTTTTLDVKNALRQEDYFVIQKTVSETLRDLETTDEFPFTYEEWERDNGTVYRLYSYDYDRRVRALKDWFKEEIGIEVAPMYELEEKINESYEY